MSTFGHVYRVTTFGESHGVGVGCIIDGVPPNLSITEDDIQPQLSRRRPGATPAVNTSRNEADRVMILSGTEFGKSLGSPIACMVHNTDQRPHDYKFEHSEIPENASVEEIAEAKKMEEVQKNRNYIFRPSHADLTYWQKYSTHSSSGGGRSSARETIGRVIGGAVAEKFLTCVIPGFEIVAFVSKVGKYKLSEEQIEKYIATITRAEVDQTVMRCPDNALSAEMQQFVTELKTAGDSVGGQVTCVIRKAPVGLGEPSFDKLEAVLAHAMLSIPASKGFEVGSGFNCTSMQGSTHNDEFFTETACDTGNLVYRTRTNFSGGIQGGISNGENIYFNVAFKPPATISLDQKSVNKLGEETVLKCRGRHDPCIVNRAVPIVESMAAMVIMDQYLIQASRRSATDLLLNRSHSQK